MDREDLALQLTLSAIQNQIIEFAHKNDCEILEQHCCFNAQQTVSFYNVIYNGLDLK